MQAAQLPQNLDAERSVLGGVLLSNDALDDVLELVKPEDFYRGSHARIFEAMLALAGRRDPIDVVTLGEELKRRGVLEDVGGVGYLATLDAAVPTTANLAHYGKIVGDMALARRLIQASHAIARDGYELRGDVEGLIDRAESTLFAVTEARTRGSIRPMPELVKAVFAKVEQLYERETDITGLPTGFRDIDRMTAGLQGGDLIIVAGRPSMGKTAVAMNMAAHVAIDQKRPVAVFSLEMGAEALTLRMFASEARVDSQRLRTGKLLDSDWPKLARAADRLFGAPLSIDDGAGLTALAMRAVCRRLKARLGDLGLVVVDYLQLMRGRDGIDSREQEISDISRGLKALARELECPVIALSQLNRSLEKREDKRPMLSDLRESGAIEQDADVICFVYRDEVYNKETPDKGIAEIIIGKQRNGPTGTVRVAFLKDYTRFENLAEGT